MTSLDKAFENFLEKIANSYLDVITHCGNPKYGVSYRIVDHSNRFQMKISRSPESERLRFLVTANVAFLTQEQRLHLYYAAEKRVKSDKKKYEVDTRMIKLKEDFQMMYGDVL